MVPAGGFPRVIHLENLLDSVHQLRPHAVSWQHSHGKGAFHSHVLGLQTGSAGLKLERRQRSWRGAGTLGEEGSGAWVRQSRTCAYLAPGGGLRHDRGTQAPPCSGIRGGDQRLRQTHTPLRSGLGPSEREYFSEPATNRPPSHPPRRVPVLTRVSQRTPLRAAMFAVGSRGKVTPESSAALRLYFRSGVGAGWLSLFLQHKARAYFSSSCVRYSYAPLPLEADAAQNRFVPSFIFGHPVYVET